MEGATLAKDRSPRLTWRVRGTRSRADEDEHFTIIINQEVVAAEGTTSKTIASRTNIKTTKML
jgi:hypothetical protein